MRKGKGQGRFDMLHREKEVVVGDLQMSGLRWMKEHVWGIRRGMEMKTFSSTYSMLNLRFLRGVPMAFLLALPVSHCVTLGKLKNPCASVASNIKRG